MTGHRRYYPVRLGEGARWWTQGRCGLRSPGFPAALVARLCDGDLAAAADRSLDDPTADAPFVLAYDVAATRLSAAVREIACDPPFREAVAWQNPAVLRNCLDAVATGRAAKNDVRRRRELLIAKYVQRYATKNDTIGFFGPVGWARWTADGPAVALDAGNGLLAGRSVYFESWAMDAVAEAFARDPHLLSVLRPRLADDVVLEGERVRRSRGKVVDLTVEESALLRACADGRTVQELSETFAEFGRRGPDGGGDPAMGPPVLPPALVALAERDLVRLDLLSPLEARPENSLRRVLRQANDVPAATARLRQLDALVGARDEVAAAATEAELRTALAGVGTIFERITGHPAVRRPGEMYAGRTPVYHDSVRDLDLRLGSSLLGRVSGALNLLLDSAEWLVGHAALIYRRRLGALYDRCLARGTGHGVPLAVLAAAAAPDLAFSFSELAPPVVDLVAEFQRRWQKVLRVPPGVRRHTVSSAEIAARAREQFPQRSPCWSSGTQHSPDLMLAAASLDDIDRGNFLVVLGELHVAMNTLDARFFVEQDSDPGRLLDADEVVHGTRRVVAVPARESGSVNSRTYPSALLSPKYTYWTMHARSTGAPGPIIPAADLVVHRVDDDLVVRSRRSGREWPLLEFFGEYLSAAISNSCAPVASGPHRPRVTIDRLVVSRESWRVPVGEIRWPFARAERDRYREARRWRAAQAMPERVFYRAPGEDKPVFADFGSIALVNLLAAAIRRAAREDPSATLSLAELLPDLDQLWLQDSTGATYTSELRLVCSDPQRWAGST